MSDKERFDLVQLWGRIAPFEPNNWDWSCRWQVWEADHHFLPDGFLAPDPQDETWDSAHRGNQQANTTYDFRHQH